MPKRSSHVVFRLAVVTVLVSCARPASGRSDSTRAPRAGSDTVAKGDPAERDTGSLPDSDFTALPAGMPQDTAHAQQSPSARSVRLPPLSPEAQRIADGLVFAPRNQAWFLVAARAKRLLVDLGRADVTIGKDSLVRAAFAEAAQRYSPLPPGTVFRLHGPWGVEDATIGDFDTWNGRIVAHLNTSSSLAAFARRATVLVGIGTRVDPATLAAEDSLGRLAADSAARADSIAKVAARDSAKSRARGGKGKRDTVVKRDSAKVATVCVRDSVPSALTARVVAVLDSLERWLDDSAKAPYPRLEKNAKAHSWAVPGCYGIGHVIVFAGRRNPTTEFAVERAVMVGDSGSVLRLRVSDLRFHFHEPLGAFDADGDGIDDVATRSLGERSGGLTIMRLDTASRRLRRLASGFAWETP